MVVIIARIIFERFTEYLFNIYLLSNLITWQEKKENQSFIDLTRHVTAQLSLLIMVKEDMAFGEHEAKVKFKLLFFTDESI